MRANPRAKWAEIGSFCGAITELSDIPLKHILTRGDPLQDQSATAGAHRITTWANFGNTTL